MRFILFIMFYSMIGSRSQALRSPSYTQWVDPFIGTGGHGHTYPGASLPFGMVQLSPDTRLTGWDGCSAYHNLDSVIYGFSHTHLSGTGVPDYGDILFMPRTGPVRVHNAYPDTKRNGYGSTFKKATEKASPGAYSVFLDDYQIQAELTATLRCGFHRYTFLNNQNAHILIDLLHRDPVLESFLEIVNHQEIAGMRRSRAWAKDQVVYFVARFSKPFQRCDIAIDDLFRKDMLRATGQNIKSAVYFQLEKDEPVLVKVGISAVSIDGARENLNAEIPHWDFDRIRRKADSVWNQALGRIHVQGGSKSQKRTFYTALYHTLLNPNLFMDVDGHYRGTDLEIHRAENFTNYTVFSLWDTYRATHPLFTLIEQERSIDFIKTMMNHYEKGGRLPMWELAANYTGCMIGYHAVPVIADSYIKGIRDFDVNAAYQAMIRSAEADWLGLDSYKRNGFIPVEDEEASVSKTLEYAYDDWCIAQMAGSLGKNEDYKKYIQRAQFYKNLFDNETGFMRPKFNGAWLKPFDPKEVTFHYTEANAWQYSFYVPQDIQGLIRLMDGPEQFCKKLDDLFLEDSRTTGRVQADITGLIGQYAHGNEPSHHMAYLYSYAGQPGKTQFRVRQILDSLYTDQPDGLCGNEDCGQMSAWYVLSAMGFYPVTPGSDIYIIGTPLFPKAVLHLENGKRFIIEAKNVSKENYYIQSSKLNRRTYSRSFLSHQDIMRGGTLDFEMGPFPHPAWGKGKGNQPVSEITDHPICTVPFVISGERTFFDSTVVRLASDEPYTRIYFTLDGSEPDLQSDWYTRPLLFRQTTELKMFALNRAGGRSPVINTHFHRIDQKKSISIHSRYSSQYSGGGDSALIDGLRGENNFRNGFWQGYQDQNFKAVVDLGEIREVYKIGSGFLQDIESWIWMPVSVRFSVSSDSLHFDEVAVIQNDVPDDRYGAIQKDFEQHFFHLKTRYILIEAENYGVLPHWHLGAGGKSWLFIDEIVLE